MGQVTRQFCKKKTFMRKRHPSQITNVVMSKKCNYNNYDL